MKIKLLVTIIFLYIIGCLFESCKDDEVVIPGPQTTSHFYPLDSGYWIEYQVDSIIHLNIDDQYLVDTSLESYHFYIREEVDSAFIDGEGKQVWAISRYKRNADSLPWEFTSLWTAKLSSTSLERVEDNLRFIRMVFPLRENRKWNGNAYNTLDEEDYIYSNLFLPKTYSSLYFDSTVVVNQNDFISNINRIIKKEVYGNHVGLLYKEIDSVGTAITMNGIIILNGLEYKQTVSAYKH